MNLIGDGIHNFLDGMIIGASYAVSLSIGIATTLAVILHEIPQEIGDFGILLHGGLTRKKALFFNFLTATLAIAGTVISLVIGTQVKKYSLILLPVTAGGFIYIAGSDLIPELHKELSLPKSIMQFISMLFGIAIMALLVFLD
jgi:zinc and cadmium transporter